MSQMPNVIYVRHLSGCVPALIASHDPADLVNKGDTLELTRYLVADTVRATHFEKGVKLEPING